MSAANLKNHGFSSDVRMQLHLNGHAYSIGQLGPDFVILDDLVDHPPGAAEIAVCIDGREKRWPIHLPDGITAGRLRTNIVAQQ